MAYNANVNISGGTKFVKYFAAVDFQHEGDLFREWDNNRGYQSGYGYNRINVRSNLDFQLTKTTVLKANIAGSHGLKRSPGISVMIHSELHSYGKPPTVHHQMHFFLDILMEHGDIILLIHKVHLTLL